MEKGKILEAIKDYMILEEETSLRYPFLKKWDELTHNEKQGILAVAESDETEEIYQALSVVVGLN